MRGALSVVQENVGRFVAVRMESSGSDPLVQTGFVRLSQEALFLGYDS